MILGLFLMGFLEIRIFEFFAEEQGYVFLQENQNDEQYWKWGISLQQNSILPQNS